MLATIEFHPDGTGTRFVITEQGVFIDGYEDNGSREQGTNWLDIEVFVDEGSVNWLADKIVALFD